MAMDKAIESGKEHRKQYMKLCEQIDKTCRCHGGCEYCLSNRMYQYNKMSEKINDKLKEWKEEGN